MTFILVLQALGDKQYAVPCKSTSHAMAYMECQKAEYPSIRQTIVEVDCPELADLPQGEADGK